MNIRHPAQPPTHPHKEWLQEFLNNKKTYILKKSYIRMSICRFLLRPVFPSAAIVANIGNMSGRWSFSFQSTTIVCSLGGA